jgi:hypothetical protein
MAPSEMLRIGLPKSGHIKADRLSGLIILEEHPV